MGVCLIEGAGGRSHLALLRMGEQVRVLIYDGDLRSGIGEGYNGFTQLRASPYPNH